jgi:two-component system, OmpR family, phosphate regulon response regulator PhoB
LAAPHQTIAVLVANPALSSILTMVLAAVPSFRVRPFESEMALTIYMRLAPVDLVVTDFDAENARADLVTRDLRDDSGIENPAFQVIALASSVTPETKALCIKAGIDEVIVKPMSPKYLLERVQSRLKQRAAPKLTIRDIARRAVAKPIAVPAMPAAGGNVIQLWTADRPLPQH